MIKTFKRHRLRTILSLAILINFLADVACAGSWESLLGVGSISRPRGAAVWGKQSRVNLLWGKNPDAEKSSSGDEPYLYGFLRTSLKVQSSILVNGYDGQLEIFPISFLSLGLGQEANLRSMNFSNFDCSRVQCRGILTRRYLRTSLTLGYDRFFIGFKSRYERLEAGGPPSLFGDEISTLVGAVGGDRLFNTQSLVGAQLISAHSAGLSLVTARMQKSGQKSDMENLFYRYALAPWELTVGVGIYRSSLVPRSFSGFVSMERSFSSHWGFSE